MNAKKHDESYNLGIEIFPFNKVEVKRVELFILSYELRRTLQFIERFYH